MNKDKVGLNTKKHLVTIKISKEELVVLLESLSRSIESCDVEYLDGITKLFDKLKKEARKCLKNK